MIKIQDWQAEGKLQVRKISAHHKPADLLTKAMTHEKLLKFGFNLDSEVKTFKTDVKTVG